MPALCASLSTIVHTEVPTILQQQIAQKDLADLGAALKHLEIVFLEKSRTA